MIKVNVLAVGKIKEKYFNEAVFEYEKRLSKFCEFKIIEIAEENFAKVDDALIEVIKEKEGEKILPHLKGHVIAMAIEGKKVSSVSLAQKIKGLADMGKTITFIIGGSYGLSDKVKERATELISFSDATFPHTLFRVMLCEQVYRAFCINAGSPYHK
jgi:23S rRNA (pseudouridine1915-N3)-methyltransferase